jgi:prepilin-type N-terminal cleavage/methylation domain-containing protein/prepilin-type processing-associated H-X9-DG protein
METVMNVPSSFLRLPKRSAFTLVEILVTISIIGVMLALLMPAIQGARESARRSSCSSNISQIAKAFRDYEARNESLPGWRNKITGFSHHPTVPPAEAAVSWTVSLLPHVGKLDLYDWFTAYGQQGSENDEDVRSKVIDFYVCPAMALVIRRQSAGEAANSYAVNAGSGCEALQDDTQPLGDGVFFDGLGNQPDDRWYDSARPQYRGRGSSLALIGTGDGETSTVMLSERSGLNVPLDIVWGSAPRPPRPFQAASAGRHTILLPPGVTTKIEAGKRTINASPETLVLPDPQPAEYDSGDYFYRYPSSSHRGGAFMAFCDGHVQFVNETIAPWVYVQIMTSNSRLLSDEVKSWQRYQKPEGGYSKYTFSDADLRN